MYFGSLGKKPATRTANFNGNHVGVADGRGGSAIVGVELGAYGARRGRRGRGRPRGRRGSAVLHPVPVYIPADRRRAGGGASHGAGAPGPAPFAVMVRVPLIVQFP